MSELMVLLQALLLIAGWLLFLRAQTELRAQAARQSLTGELEALRQTVDALLQKLAAEAAAAEARIETRLRELESRGTGVSPVPASHSMGVSPVPASHSVDISPVSASHSMGISPVPMQVLSAPEQDTLSTREQALEQDAPDTESETFTLDSGYNLTVPETSLYGAVAMLAQQGLSVPEIARQTGYAPGEVELILSLKRRTMEENG